MQYEVSDKVLPILDLKRRKTCRVIVDVGKDAVRLQVGPRDWEWDKKTGKLIACGTDVTSC